jgi:long-subunit fatty acid transport protein
MDYEFADFGSAQYDFGANFGNFNDQVNGPIQETYRFNHQLRLGTEFAIKSFRVRGGMAFQTSPFSKQFDLPSQGDLMRLTFSAGLGYVWKKFNVDLAYITTRSDEFYQPYSIVFGQAPFATLSYVERRIVLTAALKF